LTPLPIQTFNDYEVVVTDDSPDTTVQDFIDNYREIKGVKYFRNSPALGTPKNWNEGIRRSSGKWIKLMHDDDWFAQPDALETFYKATVEKPQCAFFFSAFQNVMEEDNKVEVVRCTGGDKLMLWLSPLHLFGKVYVGNPSCTFVKRDLGQLYDSRFKFVVDFEYYIRCFKIIKSYWYVDRVLLNIGFNKEQVTKYTFLVPEVQIPENLLLLEKLGAEILRNPVVYDYYWRMLRNLKIRSVKQVQGSIPVLLIQS
jgi:glycosyltransferase involved in cell wall biosynthesis